MKAGMYVIYDNTATEIVGGLQMHKHEAAAVRTFTDAVLHPDSRLRLHPEDYTLMRVGYINLETAEITDSSATPLINAAQIIAAQPKAEG